MRDYSLRNSKGTIVVILTMVWGLTTGIFLNEGGASGLPERYDLRDVHAVTPVKLQNCGRCWVYAALAALESKIILEEPGSYNSSLDLSENNLANCNFHQVPCGDPGTEFIATNYLTQVGAFSEGCEGCFDPNDSNSCLPIKRVSEWHLLSNGVQADPNTIKEALFNGGPVVTRIYSSFGDFQSFGEPYVLYYTGVEKPDHYVLIVGWDDNIVHGGGSGAWIVKNSWGQGWKEDGYCYIAYGSASIGTNANQYFAYKDHNPLEAIRYYDKGGWNGGTGSIGGVNSAWGAVRFTLPFESQLQSVEFWAVRDNLEYEIIIYGNASQMGSTTYWNMDNELTSQSGRCDWAGYYSVDLDNPVSRNEGEELIIAVRFTTSDFNRPVPIYKPADPEDVDLNNLNSCFINTRGGQDWYWISTNPGNVFSDYYIGIRGRFLRTENTLIELESFQVTYEDGYVHLMWQTNSEIDTEGFYVLRSNSQCGEYMRIHSDLIPSQGGPLWGYCYHYQDINPESGKKIYYQLEEIQTDGSSVLHDTVSISIPGERLFIHYPALSLEQYYSNFYFSLMSRLPGPISYSFFSLYYSFPYYGLHIGKGIASEDIPSYFTFLSTINQYTAHIISYSPYQ